MRIGFVGGGTGGHFYPLVATAEFLTQHSAKPELYYFGPSPYSKELLQEHNIKFVYVPAGKLRRYFSLQNILDIGKAILGIPIAIVKLYLIYPDVIFSKGGYTSIPILSAAWFLRIPVVIHESDVIPGRANKFAKRFAKYIAISWEDTAEYFAKEKGKVALTGIPIRESIKKIHEKAATKKGNPEEKPLL